MRVLDRVLLAPDLIGLTRRARPAESASAHNVTHMARVGGRNLAMSWVGGVICAGVVGALVWFSIPILPTLAAFAGDALRTWMP